MKTLYSKTIVFSLLKKSFVILCTLIMMLTMIPSVFAAYGPSSADLKEIGSQIEYPKDKEYLDDYAYGTIIAPKGHSVYCYGSADRKGSQYTVLDGEEVVVLAKRKDMLCVIIPSQNKARWINEANVYFYDESINNGESRRGGSNVYGSGAPSSADLEEIGSQIEYPKRGEYWSSYVIGTVLAPKGHSVYCYGSADRKGSQYTVLDGETVVILASRGDMLCVIIPSLEKARWIRDEYVLY